MTTQENNNPLDSMSFHVNYTMRLESVKLAYTVFKDLNSFTASSWQSLSETQQREAFEEIFVIADLVYEYIMGNKVELPE